MSGSGSVTGVDEVPPCEEGIFDDHAWGTIEVRHEELGDDVNAVVEQCGYCGHLQVVKDVDLLAVVEYER